MLLFYNWKTHQMVRAACAVLVLGGFAASAQAGIIVSFAGTFTGDATLAQAVDPDPYTPLVVTVDIGLDGTPSLGSISTATAAGDAYAAGFSVSGTATGGFGSTVTLSLRGEADTSSTDATPASRAILGRNPGGIGMRNGNSGRIDNGTSTVNERINVEFDATDALLVGQQVRLQTIGIAGSNNIGPFVPDLGVTDFDNTFHLTEDVTTAGTSNPTPSFYPIVNGDLLAGGSTGTIAISQPDAVMVTETVSGGNSGFRLNAIGFDIVSIPEPSSLLLLTIPTMLIATRLRRRGA